MNPTIKIKLLHPDAKAPRYMTDGAAGIDLYSIDHVVLQGDGGRAVVGTHVAVEIPPGFEGQIRPRSGLASKGIVGVLGTIDCDYRGELKVMLINHDLRQQLVHPGDRIAQLVIAPVARARVEVVEELSETVRGSGGLGSTGSR